MTKKYLIVSGDSFTEGHNMGEQASWAYWVAKELNLELINLGRGGKGNEWISNTLLTFLNKEEISLNQIIVMVGWSDVSRQSIFLDIEDDTKTEKLFDIVPSDLIIKSDNINHYSRINWIYKNRKILAPILSNILWCVFKTYQSIFYTKIFLQSKKIPFLFFDVITDNKIYYKNNIPYFKNSWKNFSNNNLEELPYESDLISNMTSKKNVDYIFDKKYINFEGNTLWYWLKKEGNFKYEVGNDGHTNIDGAKEISKYIVEQYKNIYL
jgi:hypothetical protein